MKKYLILLYILLATNSVFSQQTWKSSDLKWCPTVLPEAMELLLEKPHLKGVEDSILLVYEEIIQEKGQKWIRKPADKNCLSPNPDDCLVWCLVDYPALKTIRQKKVPLDSDKIIEIEKGIWIEKRFYDEAVIYLMCQEEAKPAIKTAILKALIDKKLIRRQKKSETDEEFALFCESNFQKALTTFQEDNGLPENMWEQSTLEALGIIQ
jgi:hypothetical protein